MTGVIYKITSPTGLVYIGQTINFERRLRDYKRCLAEGQQALRNSFLKHGFDNHVFEIIEEVSKELLFEREKHYIKLFDSVKSGLNIHPGGKGGLDIRLLPNYESMLSKLRDRKGSKNPNFGNHFNHSKEAIAKMRLKKITKKQRENWRTALRVTCLNDGLEFGCIKNAAEYYGLNYIMVLKSSKDGKPYKGYSFKRIAA